jgi:hypothetical protein
MFFYSESPFVVATGGTISDITVGDKTYRVHTFTTNGTFTIETGGTVEYLVVGAGGAGGSGFYGSGFEPGISGYYIGNGGDAGQMLTGSLQINAQELSVVVGSATTGNGNASSFSSITASGGLAKGSSRTPIDGVGAAGTINGLQSSIDGTTKYYAGGGARGGGYLGGLGGGGRSYAGWSGGNGQVNTGGGGGGGQRDSSGFTKSGGVGGSGIVIVRYQIA